MVYGNEKFGVVQVSRRLGFEIATHLTATVDVTLKVSDPRVVHFSAAAGAFTITLPTPEEGLEYLFVETAGNANAVTLDAGAGKTINGVQMLLMNAAYRTRRLRATSATAWNVIGEGN